MFRQAIAELLNRDPDIEVDGHARTLQEACHIALDSLDKIDVAVVDLLLPDGVGVDLIGP